MWRALAVVLCLASSCVAVPQQTPKKTVSPHDSGVGKGQQPSKAKAVAPSAAKTASAQSSGKGKQSKAAVASVTYSHSSVTLPNGKTQETQEGTINGKKVPVEKAKEALSDGSGANKELEAPIAYGEQHHGGTNMWGWIIRKLFGIEPTEVQKPQTSTLLADGARKADAPWWSLRANNGYSTGSI